jgi:hypothetical protein
MRTLSRSTVLSMALMLLGGHAFAQSGAGVPSPQQANGPAAPQTGENPNPPTGAGAPANDDTAHTAPVLWISSVEVVRSTHGPQLDIVRVRGLASTDGWESAELIPLTKGVPADGILDLAFVAEAPGDQTAPSGFPEVEAIFAVEPGHPFKGVRVYGASNRLTLRSFPGFVEAAAAPKDCTTCAGKYFVAKGATAPAGKAEAEVVHEESLPKTLRVVHGGEGMGRLDSDPNRMTIILEDDGRIALAFWD